MTFARDRIYILKSHGTQSNISTILNSKIQILHELVATYDKDCVNQMFRVMCRYYLPPCGNFTHKQPPTSICQEECSQVQSKCPETWQTARIAVSPFPFINCDDTSELLFPLPNCCTGAGGSGNKASSSMVPSMATPIIGTPTPTIGRFKQAFQVTHTTTYSLLGLQSSSLNGVASSYQHQH